MANKGRSERNLTGGFTHYDEHGKKVGRSDPNIFGGYTNYDAKGHKIGSSDPNLFGGYTHRDTSGKRVGESNPNLIGGYRNNNNTQGCYIATCVYGSYDCPQVWTLRRFRDYKLAATASGRAFIRTYYDISPWLVKRFGKAAWFRNSWKLLLDKMVSRLKRSGFYDRNFHADHRGD